jgi:hypothetical protein
MSKRRMPSTRAAVPAFVLVLAVGIAGSITCQERKTARVLFIGDSLVDYWGSTAWAAKIIQGIGGATPIDAQAVMIDRMGPLEEHLSKTYGEKGLTAIRKGGWDFVVLQENPYEPLRRPDGFSAAATRLATEAQKAGARVILLEPFAIAAGSIVYNASESWSGGTPAAMQALLRERVAQVANKLNAQEGRVGDAFEWALAHHPTLVLYENDKLHPSPCGAYLQACVLAVVLTGRDPQKSSWLPETGVSKAEAHVLRAAAWSVR